MTPALARNVGEAYQVTGESPPRPYFRSYAGGQRTLVG